MREKFTKALPYIITAAAITWMMAFGIMLMTDNKDTRDRLKQITKDVQDIKDSFEAYKTINEAELESIKADLKAVKENGETYTKQIEGVSKSLDSLKLDIVNKVKELNEKIRSVEEAKAEKKAAEQVAITASYEPTPAYNPPTGGCLTPSGGVHNGPSGLETYYNLPMEKVIEQARNFGIEGEYWVRDDGVKMYGDYVILACNRDVHPMGTLVETSLGTGISLDTGGFAEGNPNQVDVATAWTY
jgi:uncharacterized protein YqgV (UPF0045/DUF77 family)